MGSSRRKWIGQRAGIGSLLCGFLLFAVLSSGGVIAQESLRVTGTVASATLLGAGLRAGLESVGAVIDTEGASASMAQFCSGEADALLRLAPLSAAEREDCTRQSIELLLGHRIYAIAAGPDAPRECLDESELDRIFAPSAAENTLDWQQLDETLAEALPLTVWLPPSGSPAYALLDQAVAGFGLRADASIYTLAAELAGVWAKPAGSLALVEISDLPTELSALGIQSGDFAGCQEATVANVEAGSYPLAISAYLYIGRERRAEVRTAALAEAAIAGALSAELTLPSEAARAINRSLLTEESAIVSVASDSFVIPSLIGGEVRLAGTAEAAAFLPDLVKALSANYPSLTTNGVLRGGPASETALCSNVIDLALTVAPLSAEALAACESAGIPIISLTPAAQAVVALSSRANAKLRCLRVEDWAEIWAWPGAPAAEGETELLLFAPPDGDSATDLMMSLTRGQALPIRRDTEVSDDPFWRAAAVGVVENGLSYFSWGEYQQILAAGQENIQAVRMGSDCLAPNETGILNGDYPLSRPVFVHINATRLMSVQLKSWLWFTFSGGNQALLREAGLVLRDGVALRRDLLQAFADADALAAAEEEGGEAESEVSAEEES